MFAIVSGLGHAAVSRLKSTWEKLPTKYSRAFSEMQQLMDPSRNMSRYRNLVNGEEVQGGNSTDIIDLTLGPQFLSLQFLDPLFPRNWGLRNFGPRNPVPED